MSILVVGDLHLMDAEMTSTKRAIENNKVMLDSIMDVVIEDDTIEMVMFLGDIQHKTPKKIKNIHEWRKWFKELRGVLDERSQGKDLRGVVFNRDGSKESLSDVGTLIFSVKGNHDEEIKNKRITDFTFFDELIEEGLIRNPKGVLVKYDDPMYIDFRNYGELDSTLDEGIKAKVNYVVLVHDVILTEESADFIKLLVKEGHGSKIEDVYDGCDILISGHVHSNYDMEYYTLNGKELRYQNIGSMGRTSLTPDMFRDVGYGLKIRGDLDTELIELPVIPYKDYFNMREYVKRQNKAKDFSDFSLGDLEVDIESVNLEELILEVGRKYSHEVVDTTLSLLEEVDNELDYGEE